MDRKIILAVIFILCSIFTMGLTIGTYITQSQIDKLTESQLSEDMFLEYAGFELTDELVVFKVKTPCIEKDYSTLSDSLENQYFYNICQYEIYFDRKELTECVNYYKSKDSCKTSYIKPAIIEKSRLWKNSKLLQTLSWQTKSDIFDKEDFNNFITNEELNKG